MLAAINYYPEAPVTNQRNNNPQPGGFASKLPVWMRKTDQPPYFALILAGAAALTLFISPFVSFIVGLIAFVVSLRLVRWDEGAPWIGIRAVVISGVLVILSAIMMRVPLF